MSKNKNYHNYKNYSNNTNTETEEFRETEVTTEEPTTVEQETAVAQEPIKPTPVIGTVTNCQKLRVRAESNTESYIICEIESGSEVTIDKTKSTKDFYAVCTSAGVEGFCMKKFITIK